MKSFFAIAMTAAFALVLALPAEAGSSCSSRKSGSYTKTSCSHSGGRSSHCTSYMSGHTRKTYCS